METNEYYHFLKFCPECGKALEHNPIEGVNSCFLHGDFVITNDKVTWRFTKNLIRRN